MRVSAAVLLAVGASGQVAEKCEAPLEKYFSVDLAHGFCGEACMDPAKYKSYKPFEPNLTKAYGDVYTDKPCRSQTTPTGVPFTVYDSTQTHGFPGILSMTLDLWGPAGAADHSCCKTSHHPTCMGVIGHSAGPFSVMGMGPFCCPRGGTESSPCAGAMVDASPWSAIVDHVNSNEYGWTAAAPARFGSFVDVPEALGAYLPGDMEYEEPDVIEIPPSNGGLPASFDAASTWPECTVIANVRDQSTCGSCWAFASTESFEGRRCIATGEDIHFSTEDTAFCQPFFGAGHGCNGGNSAWSFFTKQGVVTGGNHGDTAGCLPYSFAPCAHHVPATADYPACAAGEGPSPKCASSCSVSSYGVSYKNDKHKAARSYSVRTVPSMQQDLVAYGPMYVAFSVYSDFPTYKSGVYRKTRSSGSYLGGHAVCLVGYGVESGTDYWKIKNSWNNEWGDAGHFKIVSGTNECGIEGSASGGTFASTTVV